MMKKRNQLKFNYIKQNLNKRQKIMKFKILNKIRNKEMM